MYLSHRAKKFFHPGKFSKSRQEPVAHAYNPSYSGGTDQDDSGLKPAQASSSLRPYLKKTQHKTGLAEWFKW
jgi:hypothetical protein